MRSRQAPAEPPRLPRFGGWHLSFRHLFFRSFSRGVAAVGGSILLLGGYPLAEVSLTAYSSSAFKGSRDEPSQRENRLLPVAGWVEPVCQW